VAVLKVFPMNGHSSTTSKMMARTNRRLMSLINSMLHWLYIATNEIVYYHILPKFQMFYYLFCTEHKKSQVWRNLHPVRDLIVKLLLYK